MSIIPMHVFTRAKALFLIMLLGMVFSNVIAADVIRSDSVTDGVQLDDDLKDIDCHGTRSVRSSGPGVDV